MARIARVVVPGFPHHITQRGNRRQQTFFCDGDYRAYLGLMSRWCRQSGVEIWSYCLMPNHIHLIAVPVAGESLHKAIAEAHRRYARMINFREGWRGFLWQGRFQSYPMDEHYVLAAARYIEQNPVRAKLVKEAWEYPWSSARAHVEGEDDSLAKVGPILEMVGDWKKFLAGEATADEAKQLRQYEQTDRPLGNAQFIRQLEQLTGRMLRKLKPGPKGGGKTKDK